MYFRTYVPYEVLTYARGYSVVRIIVGPAHSRRLSTNPPYAYVRGMEHRVLLRSTDIHHPSISV